MSALALALLFRFLLPTLGDFIGGVVNEERDLPEAAEEWRRVLGPLLLASIPSGIEAEGDMCDLDGAGEGD